MTTSAQTIFAQNETVAAPLVAVDALKTLPESDAVMFVDVRRALEAVPSVLASDPEHLTRINDKLASFTERTGIDPQFFDSVAIGVRYPAENQAARIAVLLQGRFSAGEIIKAGLAYGQLKGQPQPQIQDYSTNNKTFQFYVYDQQGNDFAFAALNQNTIVAGNRAGVRAAVDAAEGSGAQVSSEIVALAERSSSTAIASFGGNLPASFASQVGGNGGQIVAQIFNNVRQFYGSTNLTETTGEILIGLRTTTAAQAQSLASQLNVFKQFASLGFLSGTSGSLLSVINNLEITGQNQDVQISLKRSFAEVADLLKQTKVNSRSRKQ